MSKQGEKMNLREDMGGMGRTESQPSDIFLDISNEWLCSLRPQLKASSVAKYINILESYLFPEYGTRRIHTISRREITVFCGELLTSGGSKSQGLAPKTVNGIISVIKSIFEYSEIEKCIAVANVQNIFVRQPCVPMRILSQSEQRKFSRYLCSDLTPCHLGILLCLYTGLRIGEICALKWGDIHFEEQYIYVHRAMQRIRNYNDSAKRTEIQIAPPKSGCSIRKIPIPGEILRLLVLYQKEDDAFLLTGMTQSYIEPRCLENHFKAAAKKCDIGEVHFHTLRHTFATRCVELGFDVKSLSEILGHASVNITLNRYVHPSMELKQKNMEMLSGLLTVN